MKKTALFLMGLPFLLSSCGGEVEVKEEPSETHAEKVEVIVSDDEMKEINALQFDCASTSIDTLEAWPEAKASILAGRQDGKILLLVGPYYNDEIEKKGTVRANGVALLLEDAIAPGRFGYGAHYAGDCEETKIHLLHELKYKWVWRNKDITENYDHTLVYYKFDSDEEIKSEMVSAYFDEVAAALIQSGETVKLTGHTDAEGTDEYNVELGIKRAAAFQKSLIRRNVPEDQIIVESMGRSMPVESNETEEGRQKNRRVELRVIEE